MWWIDLKCQIIHFPQRINLPDLDTFYPDDNPYDTDCPLNVSSWSNQAEKCLGYPNRLSVSTSYESIGTIHDPQRLNPKAFIGTLPWPLRTVASRYFSLSVPYISTRAWWMATKCCSGSSCSQEDTPLRLWLLPNFLVPSKRDIFLLILLHFLTSCRAVVLSLFSLQPPK